MDRVTMKDRGNFLLLLIFIVASVFHQQCRSEDTGSSSLVIHPSNIREEKGRTLSLGCYMDSQIYFNSSNGHVEKWLHNNTNVTVTERHQIVLEKSETIGFLLTIVSAQFEDSGYYQCRIGGFDSELAYVLIEPETSSTTETSDGSNGSSLDQYFGPMITGLLAFIALILFSAVVVIILKHRRCALCQEPEPPPLREVLDFNQEGRPRFIVTVEDDSPQFIGSDQQPDSSSENRPDVIPPSPVAQTTPLPPKISSETLMMNTPSEELLPDKTREKLAAFPLITRISKPEPVYAEPQKKTNIGRGTPPPPPPPIPPKPALLEETESKGQSLNTQPQQQHSADAKDDSIKPPISLANPNPSTSKQVMASSPSGNSKKKKKKEQPKKKKVAVSTPSSTWRDDKVVYAELDFSKEVGMNIIVPEEGQEPLNTTFVLRSASKTS